MTALAVYVIFSLRAPVIILVEQSFINLYGEKRAKRESLRSSITLFRPVKTVTVANDAGDDIVPYAINEVSLKPFYVLFPSRFIRSAGIYNELNPGTRIVILEGRLPVDRPANYFRQTDQNIISPAYFLYKTDIEADFYRAGLAAAAIASVNEGNIAVFHDSRIDRQARTAFSRGVEELAPTVRAAFFTSITGFNDTEDLSCVVLAGAGSDYFDKKSGIPVILFSWLDPSLAPVDTVIVIDDSPWAAILQVAGFLAEEDREGLIKSNFTIVNDKVFNREILRKLRKMH